MDQNVPQLYKTVFLEVTPQELVDWGEKAILQSNRPLDPEGRVFANGPETLVQSQVASYQRL